MLGLRALLSKKMLEISSEDTDFNGNVFTAYRVSDTGISWLIANQKTLALKHGSPFDDEIPF